MSGDHKEARSAPRLLPRPAAQARQASKASGRDILAKMKGVWV